jgi:hypothetical protein
MKRLRPRANEGSQRPVGCDRRHDSLDDDPLCAVGRQLCFRKHTAQSCQLPKTLAAIGAYLEMPANFVFFVG